jgi:hypothetical protein
VFAGCPPVLGDELFLAISDAPSYADRCKRHHSNGVKLLKEDSSIDEVVLTSNWMELPWRIQGHSPDGLPAMTTALTKLIKETSAPDRRFFLMGMVPHLPSEVVECAVRDSSKLLRRPCVGTARSPDPAALKRISRPTDQMLIEVAKSLPSVVAVIPVEKICGNDACELSVDGEFLYRDTGHIRRNLSLQARKHFADRIGLTAALANGRQDAAVRLDLTNHEAR